MPDNDPYIPNETYSLSNVPIFSAGTWHGDVYSEPDLDAIVESFQVVGFKPPIKLGHSEKQKLLQEAGLPSAGWIERVYRSGKILFADFSNIPKKIFQLLERKAYGPVSVELFWNYKDTKNGKTWPRVLRAVALLGADIPEVTTIDGTLSLFDESGNGYKVIQFKEISKMSEDEKKMEDVQIEKFQKEIDEAKLNNQKLEERVKKFEELAETAKAENLKLLNNLESERSARHKEGMRSKVLEYTRARKITPAQAALVESILCSVPSGHEAVVKYSKDGQTEEKKESIESVIEKFMTLQVPYLPEKEITGKGIDSEDIDVKVKAFCKENNLNPASDYTKALREMSRIGMIEKI